MRRSRAGLSRKARPGRGGLAACSTAAADAAGSSKPGLALQLGRRSLTAYGPPSVIFAIAGCSSGPHPRPGVRFAGVEYSQAFMIGLDVPEAARRPIGNIEAATGGIPVSDQNVYAVEGLDPTQVVFVIIPARAEGGPGLDLFVSTVDGFDSGSKPWPAELCRYLKPGWVRPGVPPPCAAPLAINFAGEQYQDSEMPFAFPSGILTALGPFAIVDGKPADGLGTVAFRILDLPPDHAVAVAQGPDSFRVYLPGKGGFFNELCPYLRIDHDQCDAEMTPASPR